MLQRISFILRSLTLVPLFTIFWVAGACAQGHYDIELAKAEQIYNEGFFDQVIALANACVNKGDLTTTEQAWAYKLLGQAYISKNELQSARIYVQKLLAVAPDYEPDRDQDLQMWIELVEAAKQEREQQIQQQQLPKPPDDKPVVRADLIKKGGGKKWLWIGGGGAVVAGTAAFVIFRGDNTKQRLPDPPTPPPRP